MNEPKDFQRASAQHIVDLFKSGQRRILLADEVGLGKTTVAKAVVDLVRQWHEEDWNRVEKSVETDGFFRVVYICSNINIATQNIGSLGIDDVDKIDISKYRLSMAHYHIYHLESALRKDKLQEQIIPLTPVTSFQLTNGGGRKEERALLYQLLYDYVKKIGFYGWMKYGCEYFDIDEIISNDREYVAYMHSRIDEKLMGGTYGDLIGEIEEAIEKKDDGYTREILGKIRRMFAEITMDMLKPDLVIMDEFQRFKELLVSKNEEEHMLVDRFLKNKNTNVLLLSATPYKPYSTIEELNYEGKDQHYEDFKVLMEFLFGEGYPEFELVWNEYKRALLSRKNMKEAKRKAEEMLYRVMVRTERFNSGIIATQQVRELKITSEDVASYVQAQALLEMVEDRRIKNVPIEYIKSAPYLLSFMESYKLKEELKKACIEHKGSGGKDDMILPIEKMKCYEDIACNNARLEKLYSLCFGTHKGDNRNGSELLLWVPASRPYYKIDPSHVFAQNADFSKILVFSAWEMVPRMIAIMMSYYAEQLTLGHVLKVDENGQKYYSKYGENRLRDERKELLTMQSDFLANLYHPMDYFGWDVEDIKADIKKKLGEVAWLRDGKFDRLELVIARLKDANSTMNGDPISAPFEILAEMAIASPGICVQRCFRKAYTDAEFRNEAPKIKKLAEEIVANLFNNSIGAAIVDMVDKQLKKDEADDEYYYIRVLHYCMQGNLQAVLDEYQYLSGDSFKYHMENCHQTVTSLGADSEQSLMDSDNNKKMNFRTHYAISFAETKTDKKGVTRVTAIRNVFNSPFRPFVLATTSVGQEGLDFHLYARKIMHWNLPSNPVDLEQREGRINRYNCLAIRRNVAHLFGNDCNIKDWEELYRVASERLNPEHKYSELVPHWCLPPEWVSLLPQGTQPEMIERIVPLYPFSKDRLLYNRLVKVLSLYRLTLGQPRQEELIDLFKDYTEADQKELLIDLSPYHHG